MKILHIDTGLSWRGGQGQVMHLALGLAARGHTSVVVARPGSAIASRMEAARIPVHRIEMRGEADLAAMMRLVRLLREEHPDIVHMHTARAHTLGAVASVLSGIGRRVVSRRVVFPIGRFSARLKYAPGTACFIAISHAVADTLVAAGVDRGRVTVVPSAVDVESLEDADGAAVRASFGIGRSTPTVGTVAHFSREKGLDTLVRAWRDVTVRVPDARLILIGEGEEKQRLEREASAHVVSDSIIFAGFREDVADCISAFDVFAQPSLSEGLGSSILMAMALGRPIVATDVGGIPELVTPDETGMLVPVGDPGLLAGAIVELLERPELRDRLSGAGRQRALEHYTVDAMVDGTLAAYERLPGAS